MDESSKKIRLSRRGMLASLAAAPALAGIAGIRPAEAATPLETSEEKFWASVKAELKNAKGTKLVLLGTGAGPVPVNARHMTSNVIVHNGAAYILDCGMGVTDQFARTGIPFDAVRSIFITHHHPDHNVEYGPFLLIGWVHGLKQQSIKAYGPPPLTQMTQDYVRSMKTTIGFWAEDFKIKPLEPIETHDLATAGPVMQDENVKVTSTLVQHPPVKPAYGYRFDFSDRSIVFSGDTVPLESMAQFAKGADVLVHEAMYMPAVVDLINRMIASGQHTSFKDFMHHMVVDHTKAEDAGRIAHEAGVKTLVLYHLTPGSTKVADEKWRSAAAKHFKGEIIVGHDLMVV